jgi:inosine/xanthosine triphosphatase
MAAQVLIAVGSVNPVKKKAVEDGFVKVWPGIAWQTVAIDAPSGVTKQPMSIKEALQGATNRAWHVLNCTDARFGIGLEGALRKEYDRRTRRWRYFDGGRVVVIDRQGVDGRSSLLEIEVPAQLMAWVLQGHEVGEADDLFFGTNNAKQQAGHQGVMTNMIITRTSANTEGVVAALSRFVHADRF